VRMRSMPAGSGASLSHFLVTLSMDRARLA
jgi:hypothetical protein